MPWLPDLEAARLLYPPKEPRAARMPFFGGIRELDSETLAASFAAEPLIDDPRHGRIASRGAFDAYVSSMRDWLRDQTAGQVDPVRLTLTASRSVEEVSVRLRGEHPELPVAIVTELAEDGRLIAIRVYHSLWPLSFGHRVRPPILGPDPAIRLQGSPADYQRGLAAGDADAVVASFEPDATVREPSGGPFTYSGDAHRGIYDLMFANGGGIPLKFCTVTDDGVACAIEYICDRWGRDPIPPQAGVAIYERGTSGRLAAARIYDDVEPPASSDSSANVE